MKFHIIYDKNIILRNDGSLPDFKDAELITRNNPEDFRFEEKIFSINAIHLSSIENLGTEYKSILLREYFASHTEEENVLAFRAKALLEWYSSTRFCCSCGAPLKNHQSLTAQECTSCKKIFFPRISPCIIVVIHKDNKILLVKHTYRNQDIYACVAGFMEAGESAEHAVEREVFEETGLKIKNIIYRGSQSWPFPDQLMLGFTADWESGELKLQEDEIADAQWFDPENCPASPKPGSIAYRLIHKLY